MKSKLLLSAVLLFTISSTLCQDGWKPWDRSGTVKPLYSDDMACDTSVCVDPCPEAAPPRYCPENITSCASGCACMLECRSPTYVCFQTKFCMARRRYLTRNTKHPYYYANIAEVMVPE